MSWWYDGEPDEKNNHGIFQSLSKEMALSVIMKAMVGFLSQEMIVILTTGVNQGFWKYPGPSQGMTVSLTAMLTLELKDPGFSQKIPVKVMEYR